MPHPATAAALIDPLLRDLRAGLPAPVALMRALLAGSPARTVVHRVAVLRRTMPGEVGVAALYALTNGHPDGLTRLERMVAAGTRHEPAASAEEAVAAARELFDRSVAISPECSVAAYSLGDAGLLAVATEEVVAWLRGAGLMAARPAVLDLGCGIGRFAVALAGEASHVLGLDVSAGMVAAARSRCGALPNVRIEHATGFDLASVGDGEFDVLLACDVLPYVVQGGPGLLERLVAEIARVLRPGGHLAAFNVSYRGLEEDRRDLSALARRYGLIMPIAGTRPFGCWDGTAWLLRREPASESGSSSIPLQAICSS